MSKAYKTKITIIITKCCKKVSYVSARLSGKMNIYFLHESELHILNSAKACEVDAFKIDTKSNY